MSIIKKARVRVRCVECGEPDEYCLLSDTGRCRECTIVYGRGGDLLEAFESFSISCRGRSSLLNNDGIIYLKEDILIGDFFPRFDVVTATNDGVTGARVEDVRVDVHLRGVDDSVFLYKLEKNVCESMVFKSDSISIAGLKFVKLTHTPHRDLVCLVVNLYTVADDSNPVGASNADDNLGIVVSGDVANSELDDFVTTPGGTVYKFESQGGGSSGGGSSSGGSNATGVSAIAAIEAPATNGSSGAIVSAVAAAAGGGDAIVVEKEAKSNGGGATTPLKPHHYALFSKPRGPPQKLFVHVVNPEVAPSKGDEYIGKYGNLLLIALKRKWKEIMPVALKEESAKAWSLERDENGFLPLHYAIDVFPEYIDSLLHLLDLSDISRIESDKRIVPLFHYIFNIRKVDITIIKKLLDKGFNGNILASIQGKTITLGSGKTPLHLVVENAILKDDPLFSIRKLSVRIAELLLGDHNEGLNIRNNMGLTPFSSAIKLDLVDLATLFLSRNCEIDIKDAMLLHYASRAGSKEMLEILLEKGKMLDINAKNSSKMTPLMSALSGPNRGLNIFGSSRVLSQEEVAQIFIDDERCDLFCKDNLGNSALHYACMKSHLSLVVFNLLEKGADVNETGANLMTPLLLACKHCDHELAQMLLDRRASVTRVDNLAHSALYWISKFSIGYSQSMQWMWQPILQQLLVLGANFQAKEWVFPRCAVGWFQDTVDNWPTTMFILIMQELVIYHHFDLSSTFDLREYAGST